jgi:hypothetical protein
MRILKDKHSGIYINSVLLAFLKLFDIKLDIIR